MEDLTILYYSSSREDTVFEEMIIGDLLGKVGTLPIVSVTQTEIPLGNNICVGNVGKSYINEYRQILIGLRKIKTPYFISCESDFLYSPDYFQFKPAGENIYRSNNVWIVNKNGYRKKPYSEGAQIAKVDFMIDFIEHYLNGLPEWYDGKPKETDYFFKTYYQHQKELWRLPFTFFDTSPCISFKTKAGVSKKTKTVGEDISEIPYWGHINNLLAKYDSF